MSTFLAVPPCACPAARRPSRGRSLLTALLGFIVVGLVLAVPAQAAPTLTLANGVTNPPPDKLSTSLNPQQTAVADKAALIPVATFGPALQGLLTAEMFSAANNWSLDTSTVTLANNATFNVTQYNLTRNGAGDAFGEVMKFTLDAQPTMPNVPNGSTATLHWLQIFNMSDASANAHAGVQLASPNDTGYWYIDNGFVQGAAVDATNNGDGTNNGNNGPYYDSNNDANVTNKTFSTPLMFSDTPGDFSGVGYYIHFSVIPTWDVYTPATLAGPATDTIYVADYGVGWGFSVVPEPATYVLMVFATLSFLVIAVRRRQRT